MNMNKQSFCFLIKLDIIPYHIDPRKQKRKEELLIWRRCNGNRTLKRDNASDDMDDMKFPLLPVQFCGKKKAQKQPKPRLKSLLRKNKGWVYKRCKH